jgi:hypothetical protein
MSSAAGIGDARARVLVVEDEALIRLDVATLCERPVSK